MPAGERLVQECGVGLVELWQADGRLAFAAPALLRSGPVEEDLVGRIVAALGITRDDVLDIAWADNGPGWVGVRLGSAAEVLALTPDFMSLPVDVGVVGPWPEGSECAVEVRAFVPHAAGITRGPRHRVAERLARAVARGRRAAGVVHGGAGDRDRPPWPGPREHRRRRHDLGRRRHPHHDSRDGHPLTTAPDLG